MPLNKLIDILLKLLGKLVKAFTPAKQMPCYNCGSNKTKLEEVFLNDSVYRRYECRNCSHPNFTKEKHVTQRTYRRNKGELD